MKRALITGGSSAIGRAIALELACQGIHVIVHAHGHPARAAETVRVVHEMGGSAEALSLDLTRLERAQAVLGAIAQKHPIQIFIHNAGIQKDKPFAGMEDEDWTSVIDVTLNGFYAALRPLIMPMIRTRWGRIIAVSSVTAITGNRGQTNYAAAKGGLLALTKSLTREYASRGITANVVAPGLIATPKTEQLENFDELRKLSSCGRAGTPDEVAAVVGFLTSERAGYISGQMIAVDGGTS